MTSDVPWPPVSPHAALLSSPSGRRKYDAYKSGASPLKRSATTPSLVDRLRAARSNNDYPPQDEGPMEDDEDDEETLQLKLAAIEAKLKLKKLQKDRVRAATPAVDSSRPGSAHGAPVSQTEVKASPPRRIQPTLPKSPSRVLLGIDKGVRAADISLKRANTTSGIRRSRADSAATGSDRPISRSSAFNSTRSTTSSRTTTTSFENRKTFSERMAEARERETSVEQRRATTIRNRSRGFAVDKSEIDGFRKTAEEESRLHPPSKSPTRQYFEFSREQVLNASAEASAGRNLKKSRTMPDLRTSPSRTPDTERSLKPEGDSSLFEGFSGLHLTSRILPHSFLKRTLPTDKFTIYRIPDLLREVKSPDYELPDTVCDYVIFGVVASKSSAMDQKTTAQEKNNVGTKDWEKQWEDGRSNNKRFMALTLTDLKWTVDLYLFGTALPRYHRLTPGTVVAILNAGILPPKPGKSDTGAFSLSLSDNSDTVLEIGQARDLGYCKSIKKDGQECGSWVDASKTQICEWHLNAEIARTKAGRMGVNTGSNGFGTKRSVHGASTRAEDGGRGKRGLLARDGRKYDYATGTHFYVASTGPRGSNGGSGPVSRAMDGAFVDTDLERPAERDARLRKHLAAQAKEREIAEKLGARDHGAGARGFGFNSAGAEYLRQKNKARSEDKDTNAKSGAGDSGSQRSATTIAKTILSNAGGDGTRESRKRTAADVRLSPVKKTRFVTEKGIREAGRESFGGPGQTASDSDDELEIV